MILYYPSWELFTPRDGVSIYPRGLKPQPNLILNVS